MRKGLFAVVAVLILGLSAYLSARMQTEGTPVRLIPAADRLGVLFISHLERSGDDQTYITNRYPVGDLPAFTATGVLVNNGEEHRHNFGAYGQGYGHVMFLDLDKLVEPVSLG